MLYLAHKTRRKQLRKAKTMRARINVTAVSNGKFDFDVYVYDNGDQIVAEESFDNVNLAVIFAVDKTPNVKVTKNKKAKDFIMGSTDAMIAQVKSTINQYKIIRAKCGVKYSK